MCNAVAMNSGPPATNPCVRPAGAQPQDRLRSCEHPRHQVEHAAAKQGQPTNGGPLTTMPNIRRRA